MPDFAVQDGQTVLFVGDSITDCGRRGERAPLGDGYACLFAEMVTARWPERDIRYVNKGIGGNRVTDLRERWADDVLGHRPDWLTILIGINDLHCHLRQMPEAVSPALYRETYDRLLKLTRERTTAEIVLLEPFYISREPGDGTFRSLVLELLPAYIEVVHGLSRAYGTRLVQTHALFQEQLRQREADAFCAEPVHPNRTGHMVIAVGLLRALGG